MPHGYDLWMGQPGPTAAVESYFDSKLRWGRYQNGIVGDLLIDGAARDTNNTPTTDLRAGLVLGVVASTGRAKEYLATATDGTQVAVAVLLETLRATDFDGNNVHRWAPVLFGGPVQAANLYGLDELARGQMAHRFVFDDRYSVPNYFGWRATIAKTADYTVVNGTDNNTIFTTTGAAVAVNFTLPATLQRGHKWRFCNVVNQNMTVTAPANKLVAFNNATATSVAFSTANEKIGGIFEVWVDEGAAKYLVANIGAGANTVTVA